MKTNKVTAVIAPPANSLVRILAEVRKGDLVADASRDLATLVKEVRRTGKTGELTIKIKVRPSGEAMEIIGTCTPKLPKPEPRATTFFDTDDGDLQRDNPQQAEMFKSIDGGAHEAPEMEVNQTAVNQ